MKHLHLRNTFIPVHSRDLTYEELQMVWKSHRFLKQKQDINIKRLKVSGGNKQSKYIPKEDASSPTVST